MVVFSAVKYNDNGCLGEPVSLRKNAGIIACNVIAAAHTAENLNVFPNLL